MMNKSTSNYPQKNQSGSLINAKSGRRSVWAYFQRWEWLLVLLIVVDIFINMKLSPYFLDGRNLARASSDFMELGLMMLPMVFIIVTGGIDLSIASNLGMCASFMGLLFMNGTNIWLAAIAALILGTLGGLLNGTLIAKLKLPPLVVTLGTYAFYRGIAYVMLGDQAARNYPAEFTYLGQGKIPGTLIPFSVLLFIVLAIIFSLILHKTAFGRYLFTIGNNENASHFSGVPVDAVKMSIYALSGFMAALAGLILAARFGSTRPDIGNGMELTVITTAVLGGVDINGGIGTMGGAALSLLLIGLMRFGMGLVNIQGQVQGVAIGLLLIVSILLPNITREVSSRNIKFDRRNIFTVILFILIFISFILFFFWSRMPITAAG